MLISKIENKEKYFYKRILGIDYGEKRVGLALSDPLHIISSPKESLLYNTDLFWEQLVNIINKEEVGLIIVGKPFESTNKKILVKIDDFINKLHTLTQVDIFIFDENFSSKKALESMVQSGMKKKDRQKKGNIDKIAASIFLSEFLQEYF